MTRIRSPAVARAATLLMVLNAKVQFVPAAPSLPLVLTYQMFAVFMALLIVDQAMPAEFEAMTSY
ncbi:MAG: hypothetical protein WCJ30_25535 [Deltaproteobacteria bacterium]